VGRRQSATSGGLGARLRAHIGAWWRRAASPDASRQAHERTELDAIDAALTLLPEQLAGAWLPDGVLELVVERVRPPLRRLFDVHDGKVIALQPGATVPWTSISGTQSAWMLALGPDRDVSQLWHTGEPQLGERALAALARRRPRPRAGRGEYSALDCS
jgi:hypothetical protein